MCIDPRISRPFRSSAACLVGCLTVGFTEADAQERSLWEATLDPASGTAAAVAAFGGTVVAVGAIPKGTDLSPFAVRAFDAETGELVWESNPSALAVEDGAGDPLAKGVARILHQGEGDAADDGGADGADDNPDDLADDRNGDDMADDADDLADDRGDDPTDDEPDDLADDLDDDVADDGVDDLVDDLDDDAGDDGVMDSARDVVASEQAVVACGRLGGQFAVVAYARDSGEPLWEDRAGAGEARACAASETLLVAAGPLRTPGNRADATVRVYDLATGTLLWEDRADGGARAPDAANAVTIEDGQVTMAGTVQQTEGDEDILVRSYEADTGAMLWHQVYAGTAGEVDEALAIAAGGDRVVVAGRVSLNPGDSGSTSAVHAHDASTGEIAWSGYQEQEELYDITLQGDRVIAAGGRRFGPAFLRAYAVDAGEVLWSSEAGTNFSAARSVDTDDEVAYTAGQLRTGPAMAFGFAVRAVELATGTEVWQDLYQVPDAGARGNDVVVSDDRVVAVGRDVVNRTPRNVIVRAYRAR